MSKFGSFSFGVGVMFGVESYPTGTAPTYTSESAAVSTDFMYYPEYAIPILFGQDVFDGDVFSATHGGTITTPSYTTETSATEPTYTRTA